MKYLTKLLQRFGLGGHTTSTPPAAQPPMAEAPPAVVEPPSIDGD